MELVERLAEHLEAFAAAVEVAVPLLEKSWAEAQTLVALVHPVVRHVAAKR